LEGSLYKKLLAAFLAVLIAVAASLTLYKVLSLVQGTELPLSVVATGSMRPTLNRGDLIVVRGVSGEDVKVRDIIAFKIPSEREPIVHRVVSKFRKDGKYYFVTKGDNNPSIDWFSPIPEDYLLGKVTMVIPRVGLPILFLKTGIGKCLTIALIVACFIYAADLHTYILRRKKEGRGKEEGV